MKKLFAIVATILCLSVTSEGFSNQQDRCYNDQCVGQCVDPCVGQCEPSCGRFYVGLFGGANWLNMSKLHGFRLKSKTGFTGAASLGYAFDNGFRVEGEVSYRRNHLDFTHGYTSGKGHGSIHSWSYMANVLYDFHQFSCYCPNVVPYIGFGLGYTQNHIDVKAHDAYSKAKAKGKSNGLAGQGIAGVGYRLTDSTTLAVEYRYFVGKKHVHDHSVGLALRQSF